MKIDLTEKAMRVHRRHQSWEEAAAAILYERNAPPDGYRVWRADITARTNNEGEPQTGRRCNSTVSYTLTHGTAFDLDEAYAFFRSEPSPPIVALPGDDLVDRDL